MAFKRVIIRRVGPLSWLLATAMYKAHPNIETPAESTKIWRYIDIERFLSMLVSRQLFLCRLDNFRDPWEGSWPEPIVNAMRKDWPEGMTRQFLDMSSNQRKAHFVSCWHESSNQSAALWDLYASRSGIAIQSTVSLLNAAITDSKDYFLGRVKYIDFETHQSTELNMLGPPFIKRKSFEHEKEVRLLFWDINKHNTETEFRDAAPCHSLTIDPNVLIQRLYISPSSPPWLMPAIAELCSKFQVSAPIERSTLLDARVY